MLSVERQSLDPKLSIKQSKESFGLISLSVKFVALHLLSTRYVNLTTGDFTSLNPSFASLTAFDGGDDHRRGINQGIPKNWIKSGTKDFSPPKRISISH